MRSYKTAIVGCGVIHSLHADALANYPLAELKAVVDIDPEKSEQSARKYGCKALADYKDVLASPEIDVVHICTPHYLHAPMAIEAMKAGKHVLTEKPMAISVEDCMRMRSVSSETGKQLGICFQNRYNATSRYMKMLLESGKAGRIIAAKASVTWLRGQDYYGSAPWRGTWEQEGGGVLINQSIHTLDLLRWFAGKAVKIKGNTDTRFLEGIIEVEDTAEATILFESGARGFFFATNAYADAPVELQLVCENAVMTLSGDLTIKYNNGDSEIITDVNPKTGKKAYYGAGHAALIEDFYDSLHAEKPFAIDGSQGMETIRLINALYRSSEARAWVEL